MQAYNKIADESHSEVGSGGSEPQAVVGGQLDEGGSGGAEPQAVVGEQLDEGEQELTADFACQRLYFHPF